MLLFDAFLISKKIAHSIRRTFIGKRELHVRNYGFSFEAMPKKIPRTIWIYWDKPIEYAPPVVGAAIATWSRKNPSWTVKILNDDNIAEFVQLPQPKSPRKIQWKADLIRVSLLRDYGGVWVDATTFCIKPLDEWLPPLMQSGFFAFPDTYPGRVMQNWFMAASPENYLVERWSQMMMRYYQKRGKLHHYFWVMYMFEYLVRTDKKAAAIWNFTPKVSGKGPSLLKRLLTQQDLAEAIPSTVDEHAIPVLKISSSNMSRDQEFNNAVIEGRDIDLRKMAESLLEKR
jgi:hypothetical protein